MFIMHFALLGETLCAKHAMVNGYAVTTALAVRKYCDEAVAKLRATA
jgi:hypothetical protein